VGGAIVGSMQIKCRPVQGGDFTVDVDEDETVETLKVAIFTTRPEMADEPEDIKVILKGKVLGDLEQKLSDAGLKEGEFIAVMGKKKPQPAAAPTAAPAAAQAAVPAAAAEMAAAMAQQAQTPGTVVGPPPEEMVQTLCGMGFPREEVAKALRAAFNNPDRAMGYLLDGNIPATPADMVPPAAQGMQQPPAAAAASGPWPEGTLGPQMLTKSGMQSTSQALGGAPVVLLYFSAHWCPPCKQFTPMLAKAFQALGPDQKQVQIVFCSSDRDPTSFANYYAEMPWVALPFDQLQMQSLGQKYTVRGIPSLIALDGKTGNTLDADAKKSLINANFNLSTCCTQWGAPAGAAAPAASSLQAELMKPVVSATPKVPEPKAVEIDVAVVEAAVERLDAVEWAIQEMFYTTLLKVLNNILQNPQEAKFRSLKKGNAALKSKLFDVAESAARDLLQLAGFEDSAETIGLAGPPDGRCTAVRDAVTSKGEKRKHDQIRKERDARIAEEKKRAPARSYGGNENGRSDIGRRGAAGRGGGG